VPFAKPLVGQVGLVPEHTSWTSHTPLAARHWFPGLPATLWHPAAGAHVSTVQGLLSSQFGAAPPAQLPAWQRSFSVQALPSVQFTVLLLNTQPFAGLHVSSVHTLPSTQTRGSITHEPDTHLSLIVHASESLHVLASSSTFKQP